MIVVDTSGVIALMDDGEPEHGEIVAIIRARRGPILVTDFVVAETDYLLASRFGGVVQRAFIDQVVAGLFQRELISDDDFARAAEIDAHYADHDLGVTDTTTMALAERLAAPVLTLDRRHFSVFRTHRGKPLKLLP